MKVEGAEKPKLGRMGRRRAVSVSPQALVESRSLTPGNPLPLLVQPAMEGVDVLAWAGKHRDWIHRQLIDHGGMLFRGFDIGTVARFEELLIAIAGELLTYSYRSTPRSDVSGRIYTSTEYPADQEIPLHNEMAYSRSWPMKIGFYCQHAAARDGATPIASSRRVWERIAPEVRERFRRKRVMYVRNYGGGVDLPWQDVFQTSERAEVEAFCRGAGMEFEWQDDGDRLRTRQVCQAVATHPETGDEVWFNQAHLFHVSSLSPQVRELLLAQFGADELPRNACYGDGSPIEDAALEEIRGAYQHETVVFPWQEGDLLLLDNMLVAHGRQPFEGRRKIVVGMAESSDSRDAGESR